MRLFADQDTDRVACVAIRVSAALGVVGLLLPWTGDSGYTRDAFARSGWLSAFALVTIAATVLLLAMHRAAPEGRWLGLLRGVSGFGAGLTAVVTLGVTRIHDNSTTSHPIGTADDRWSGPALLIASLVVMAALTHKLTTWSGAAESEARSKPPRLWLVGVLGAVAGLAVAVAGLFGPWERLRGAAIRPLVGTDTLTFTGAELHTTTALRWTLAAVAATAVLTATIAPTRRVLLPAVFSAGGVVVAVLALRRITTTDVHGVAATLSPGAGAWLTAVGGIAAAAGGLLALVRVVRGRTSLAVTTALAVALAGEPGRAQQAHAATADLSLVLSGGEGSSRLGGPSSDAQVESQAFVGGAVDSARPDLLHTDTGTFFSAVADSASPALGRSTLIEQIVAGRALPVVLLAGATDVKLLTVAGGRAIVEGRNGQGYSVQSVRLDAGAVVFAPAGVDPRPGDDTSVVLRARDPEPNPGPASAGIVRARSFDVQLAADGSAYVDTFDSAGYRVNAAEVSGTKPWNLHRAPVGELAGPGTTVFATDHNTLHSVSGAGLSTPVLGGVSDPRCALSRDPLSSSTTHAFVAGRPPAATIDRAGDLWFLLIGPGHDATLEAYVLTPDGILRQPASGPWRRAVGLAIMPDGSLSLTDKGGVTYRAPDPSAVARAAAPLAPVAKGCVSDNRVPLRTAGHRVAHLSPILPADPSGDVAVVAANGTRIITVDDAERTGATVVRQTSAGRRTTLRTIQNAGVETVVADGRGGAWWVERTTGDDAPARAYLSRVDAQGAVHARVADVTADLGSNAYARLVPDTADGSVWCSSRDAAGWTRVTAAGRQQRIAYADTSTPAVRNGHGYVYDSPAIRTAATTGTGDPVLGGGAAPLGLASAIASGLPPERFVATGTLSVAPNGDLLLHQGNVLARVTSSGKVSAVADRADGLPYAPTIETETVIGDRLVMTSAAGDVYTVDVS